MTLVLDGGLFSLSLERLREREREGERERESVGQINWGHVKAH